MQYRSLIFGRANQDERTVPVVVSTDEPLDRGAYVEILGHGNGEVDLSRAPLPLVECHDTSRLNIGVVEGLKLSNGKLRGIARFGTSQRGEEVFQDVLDGVVRSVSVGYTLLDEGVPSGDGRSLRFRWMPYEVSCVPAPADTNAGFFRNFQEIQMDNLSVNEGQQTLSRSQRIAQKNSAEAERERVVDIQAMARACGEFGGVAELAEAAIREGVTTSAFQARLLDHVSTRSWKGNFQELGLNQHEVKRYSLSRAIDAHINNDWAKAGFERELHQQLVGSVKHRQVEGLLVPLADLVRGMKRDLLTSSVSTGGALVATDHRSDLFVDVLREKSLVLGLGATFINDLVGNVDIPTLAGDPTPGWMSGESSTITESQPTFGQIILSPKSCAAYVEVSRRLLKQSSPTAEQIIINSMIGSIGYSIDVAALAGSGASGVPKGLINANGVGSVTGTSLSWDGILEFEEDVSGASVDLTSNTCGWITTPAIRKLLKGRTKVAGYPEYLWQSPENRMNGYAAMAGKACPTGTLIFGEWSNVLVANWGPIEILNDPYTRIQNALVGLRAIADVDVAIKHAGAFSIAASVT